MKTSYETWDLSLIEERTLMAFCAEPDLSEAELARRLGLLRGAVVARLHKARKKMGVRTTRAAVLLYDRERRASRQA